MSTSYEAESAPNKDLWIKPEIKSLNAGEARMIKEIALEGGGGSDFELG